MLCNLCKEDKSKIYFYSNGKGSYNDCCKTCTNVSEKIIDLPNEIWRDIKGYNELYQISNFGRVKSKTTLVYKQSNGVSKKPTFYSKKAKIVAITDNGRGYKISSLSKNGRKNHYIHRLVAEAFIPNPDKKPQVNHINGIKSDNRVENLEWVSCLENLHHALDNNLRDTKGEKSPTAKLSEIQVLAIRRLYRINPNFNKSAVARKLNVRDTTIHKIINNERWKHL